MKKTFIIIRLLSTILPLLLVLACAFTPLSSKFDAGVSLTSQENKIGKSTQILLAVDNSFLFFTRTTLYTMEKSENKWQAAFEPFDAVIGRNGFAAPGEKREGDGKTQP
jgi:L,D-peptidoglycan transpeptidase YkuD (ErfK/YbiS/YcfS/YnhG family)